MIEETDAVLETVAALGPIRLAWSERFTPFLGRGVTIVSDDVPDDDEEADVVPSTDLRRVHVDVARLLGDSVAPFGLAVEALDASFLRLVGAGAPDGVELFFAQDGAAPLYAARAHAQKAVSVVIHVNPAETVPDLSVLRSLGVEPVRLRTFKGLSDPSLRASVERLVDTRKALDGVLDEASATTITSAHRDVDPARVVEYATTAADRAFESAVSRILAPLSPVIALGGKYTGRPFPDGLLVQPTSDRHRQFAWYDCKSREKDEYELAPDHGDQQSRYQAIAERLETEGWRGRGAVLFTPSVDAATFAEKAEKDFWRRLKDAGRGLIVVPAAAAYRWWELETAEGPEKLGALFDQARFWAALWDGALDGLSETECQAVWPERKAWARLFTVATAEVCFLAGLGHRKKWAKDLAESLGNADPESAQPSSVARSALVGRFHSWLRDQAAKHCTMAKLQEHLGLSVPALRYIVLARAFEPEGMDEAGPEGLRNLQRLRDELKTPSA